MPIGEENNSDIVKSAMNDILNPQEGSDAQPSQQPAADDSQPSGTEQEGADPSQRQENDPMRGDRGVDANDRGRQQKQPQAQGKKTPRADANGNILDENGNIIARAGGERRIFNEGQQALREMPALRAQMAGANQTIAAYERAFDGFKQLELTPQAALAGAQLLKAYQTDPKATLEHLLTDARSRGITIDGIGGGALDTAAMQKMMSEALRPLLQDRAAREQDARIETEAAQQTEQFFNSFPDAKTHETEIAHLVGQHADVAISEIYHRLKVFALENGLDWTKPLKPQVLARMNNGAAAAQPGNGQQPRAQLPTAARGGSGRNVTPMTQPRIAPAGTSNADIVREALREAGAG